MFERFSKKLAALLESHDNVDTALIEWTKYIEADEEYVSWYAKQGLHAWMAGQLMVRAIELDEDAKAAVTLADPASFVEMEFQAAVDFFAAKQIVSPAAFAAVQGRFKAGAFTARGYSSQAMLSAARSAISTVLEDGASIAEAAKQVRNAELALGINPAASHYIQNVVRTNVATSYGAGRYEAMSDPDVMELRPLWMFVTANDDRVRDEHAALHGKVFEAGSDEGKAYFPPLGYQCRCTMVTLSERQASRRGVSVHRGPVPDADIPPEWQDPPEPL